MLLLPGRIDAALAVWLLLGRRMLARLAGSRRGTAMGSTARLTRKVASQPGLAEVVPVRRRGGEAEPIAIRLSVALQALAQADGWILVPADSEGYPTGTEVVVRAVAMSDRSTTRSPTSRASAESELRSARCHPPRRARQEQFLEVVSAEEARARFARHLDLAPLPARRVALAAALGRVLAHDVAAPIDVPPFDRSNVDGFALRAADTAGASDTAPRAAALNARSRSSAAMRRRSRSRPAPPPRSRPAAWCRAAPTRW